MDYTKYSTTQLGGTKAGASYDVGLRVYMAAVYKYMALALALTGGVAYLAASSASIMAALFGNPILYGIVTLAPIGVAIYMGVRFTNMSLPAVRACFWLYAGLLGLSLSSLFLVFTGISIARMFFITASVFGAMSIYGYTTKRDLSGFGSFLIMGLIGLMIASLINVFLRSSMLHFITSATGVLVFTGLAAYDTQKVKDIYYQVANRGEIEAKLAIYGAFALYLDFINLFLMLLNLLGERRSSN